MKTLLLGSVAALISSSGLVLGQGVTFNDRQPAFIQGSYGGPFPSQMSLTAAPMYAPAPYPVRVEQTAAGVLSSMPAGYANAVQQPAVPLQYSAPVTPPPSQSVMMAGRQETPGVVTQKVQPYNNSQGLSGWQALVDPVPGSPLLSDGTPRPESPYAPQQAPKSAGRDGSHVYFSAALLNLWYSHPNSPPLFMSVSSSGNTRTLDTSDIPSDARIGGRVTVGTFFDEENQHGIEFSGTLLGQSSQSLVDSDLNIFRTFVATPGNSAPPLQITGIAPTGENIGPGRTILTVFDRAWQTEANYRQELWRSCYGHVDVLAGVTFFSLDETLDVIAIANLTTTDHFGSQNRFYGTQVGAEGELHWGPWFVNSWSKIAIGVNDESLDIRGNTSGAFLGSPFLLNGGFLALPSNSGEFSHNLFAALPQAGINLGLQVDEHIRMTFGYNMICLINAARPGDQIDTTVNITQLPIPNNPAPTPTGPIRPIFGEFHQSDFLAQGVSAAVELRW